MYTVTNQEFQLKSDALHEAEIESTDEVMHRLQEEVASSKVKLSSVKKTPLNIRHLPTNNTSAGTYQSPY
jgi:hypothetical protein